MLEGASVLSDVELLASVFDACGCVADGAADRLLEIARRISSEPLERAARVDSSSVVHAHFGPLLASEKRESFHVLLLDSKNGLMAKTRISEGSLGASLVHPREAFRPAVLAAAAAVIFVHNHPSGDPSPSREDHEVTARLREAGTLMGIPVLDHVVVAARGYYSFADHGWS
jgi:DNA repair protein RadC